MALKERERQHVHAFREAVESYAVREGIGCEPERVDHPGEAVLSSRFSAGPHQWYVLTVQPFLPQFSAGALTDDPFCDKDFERLSLQAGLTKPEFVQLGFEAAGLVWRDPPVQHFRDRDNVYYFVTPVDLPSFEMLTEAATIDKAKRMLLGYHLAFSGRVA